jgi:hypothetical protein
VRRWVDASPPIVVGGTGGSGTRVVRRMLARAGAFMGVRLNSSGDAMDFEPFLEDTINPLLAVTRSLDYSLDALPAPLRRLSLRNFDEAVAPLSRRAADGHSLGMGEPAQYVRAAPDPFPLSRNDLRPCPARRA